MPSAAALALALAQDSRVSGLLHKARSTASASRRGSGTLAGCAHIAAGPFQNALGAEGRNCVVSNGSLRSPAHAVAQAPSINAANQPMHAKQWSLEERDDIMLKS